MRALAVVAILLAAAAARAQPADAETAARQLLDAQVRAIDAGDAKAFAATFTHDGMLILPTAAGEAQGAAIEGVARTWLAGAGKLRVALEHPTIAHTVVADGTWLDAELVVGGVHWRLTAIVVHDELPDPKPNENPEGPYRVAAEHLSEAVDDKVALAAAAAGKLPALPAIADAETDPLADLDPSKIAVYARRVFTNSAVSLLGSAPAERAHGQRAVERVLAGWRSLHLTTTALRTGRDELAMWGFEWSIAHVDATFLVHGKRVVVPYRVLMIVDTPPAAAADRGATVQLLSVHFSVALH